MYGWSIGKYLLPCIYKLLFGIDCPICGFQRSFILLLQGHFKESFLMYPPLLPVILFIGLCFLHLFFKQKISLLFIGKIGKIVLVIVAINYSGKLIFGWG